MRARATLKEVAARSGVSIPTASTVLNLAGGNTIVSDETRNRVLAAAQKLGYQPNYHAQSLKRGRSGAIGLLLDPPSQNEHNEAWLREMARGAELRARERGHDFVIMGPRPNTSVLDRGAARAEQGGVDALLAPGGKPSLRDFKAGQLRVPFVLLWDDRYATGLPFVTADETPALNAVVEHLASLGHRQFSWLSLSAEHGEPAPERLAGLTAAAHRLNLGVAEFRVPPPPPDVLTLPATLSHYQRAASAALPALTRQTAVVCYNELLAMGLMQALWETGRRVPHDVSVIGFDDIHGRFGHPALSAVSLELAAVGAHAVDIALDLLGKPQSIKKMRTHSDKIPARFVVRESTGPAHI